MAIEVDDAVVEDRLDLLFEESDALVAVQIETGGADGASRPLRSGEPTPAFGRPVQELLVLHLTEI